MNDESIGEGVRGDRDTDPAETRGTMSATPDPSAKPSYDDGSRTVGSRTARIRTQGPENVSGSLVNYDLLREIGSGGMGVVYEAVDRERGDHVALKLLSLAGADAIARFKNEFRSLSDLSHPNLATLYELFFEEGEWFFTMELIDGIDFISYVRPTPFGVDIDRLTSVMSQIANGVSALHAAGKLHRDLKPSNVLVTRDGRAVVLDFGLVTDVEPHAATLTGRMLVGTFAYMSPEQAFGRPLTPASDWYSVGVMLYEALTGRVPFEGPLIQIVRDKQDTPAPSPRDSTEGLPQHITDLCAGLLAIDPALRPGAAEVLACFGSTEPQASTRARSARDSASIIGRQHELDALLRSFEAVLAGQQPTVFVNGRSGVGKTTVLNAFCETIAAQGGTLVLRGRCYEHESVPFKAFDSVLDELTRVLQRLPDVQRAELLPRWFGALTKLFPVLGRSGLSVESGFSPPNQHELRRLAFQSLRELLARLADRWRLVLCIDDLQWGDTDSAALFSFLRRPPDAPAMLIVGAFRDEHLADSPFWKQAVGDVEASAPVRAVEVLPLAPDDARQLALRILADGPAITPDILAHAERIASDAAGHPLFVHELAHTQADLTRQPVASLDDLLWSRVEQLDAAARSLVAAVAVAGVPLDERAAERAADVEGASRNPWRVLRDGRFVRWRGSSPHYDVECYHDRVRETVVARLTEQERRGVHRRLAEALESLDATDPEQLGIHWHGAGDAARAAKWFARAGESAMEQLAFDKAAALLLRALPEAETSTSDGIRFRRHLRVRLGEALAYAGRGPEAARQFLAAAAEEESTLVALELRRQAATQLLTSGHIDQGLGVLRELLTAIGLPVPSSRLATFVGLVQDTARLAVRGYGYAPRPENAVDPLELLRIDACWTATSGLSVVDTLSGVYYQSVGLLRALRCGESSRVARSLVWQAANVGLNGTKARQRSVDAVWGAAQRAISQTDDPQLEALARLTQGAHAFLRGEWVTARRHMQAAQQLVREKCVSATWELTTAQSFDAWSSHYIGDTRYLSESLPGRLREAEERGNHYMLVNAFSFAQSLVQLALNQSTDARRKLLETMSMWSAGGFHVQHFNAVGSLATVELYDGDLIEARRHTEALRRGLRSSLLSRVQVLRIYSRFKFACVVLTQLCADSGARSVLKREVRKSVRLIRQERAAWGIAMADVLQAGLQLVDGDVPGARALYSAGSERLERVDMRLMAAAARRREGQLTGGSEGAAIVDAAESTMREQLVVSPARMTVALIGGSPEEH